MMRPLYRFAFLIVCGLGTGATSAAAEIVGPAQVIAAGSLAIAGQPVRLFGVDAPGDDQMCPRNGGAWRCGQEAGWALAAEIERHWVTCDERGPAGADGAPRAICFIGGREG